jgi:zeaxanthin glucosyltransferase
MSRILMISPDYASHYFPMSAVGEALVRRGHQVTFATGPGIRRLVNSDGFEYSPLILGPGSNPGLMRPDEQSDEERAQIESFFEATRRGMADALLHQARNRLRDLLWQPELVASAIDELVDSHAPDRVIVDQLAFGATAALRGLGREFISFHPGHPSAISVGSPYGYPSRLPRRLQVSLERLQELKEVCREVVVRFTDEYNGAMAKIDPNARLVRDAFSATSELLNLVNYPEALGVGHVLSGRSRLIGSSVRRQALQDRLRLPISPSRPLIFVSLGSFFSARSDLLQKIVAAFRNEPVNVVLASGTTPRHLLEPIPSHWMVEPYLPQPAVLRQVDLAVTHGGNNSVTEALTAGVPLLVGPLSTDQFAGAADVEGAGLGRAFDPNFDSASTIADLASEILASDAVDKAGELGAELTSSPGQELAADLVESAVPVIVSA